MRTDLFSTAAMRTINVCTLVRLLLRRRGNVALRGALLALVQPVFVCLQLGGRICMHPQLVIALTGPNLWIRMRCLGAAWFCMQVHAARTALQGAT